LVKIGERNHYQTMKEAFQTKCNGKFSDITMYQGDIIRLVTSGGGGYGDPRQRDFERIEQDVAESYISRAQAESHYQVVLREDGTVDPEATARLRE
jgi:N-methylhydantoinase B/oxoprolinase/acetone carboxylase alpha subunit